MAVPLDSVTWWMVVPSSGRGKVWGGPGLLLEEGWGGRKKRVLNLRCLGII